MTKYLIFIRVNVLFFLFKILLTDTLTAQNNIAIKGNVYNSENAPINNALISIIRYSSGSLINNTLTDSLGSFMITGLYPDTFKISISSFGYELFQSDKIILSSFDSIVFLQPVILLPNGNNIAEVTISARTPFVVHKLDRIIINPNALITNAGSNALEVLAKSPGIVVNDNSGINLKGKSGVVVFVDDKNTYLSGTELINYLKTIQASDVKQIEIMTNPQAKYDAAGNAGIINIKTIKSKLSGWNGTAMLSFGQGRFSRTSNNFSLNYNNSKIAFFSGLNMGIQGFYQDLNIDRVYLNEDVSPNTYFNQRTYIKILSQSYNSRIGFDYYITQKTTLGINAKGLISPTKATNINSAKLLDGSQVLVNNVFADNIEKNQFSNGALNFNIRHQFDSTGKQLVADFDYVLYKGEADQRFINNVFLPNGNNTYRDLQNGNLPSTINIYAIKCDYENPLKHNAKIDAGIKTSYIVTDNEAIYTITQNNITENNYNLSNRFKYNELINAAYSNLSKSFNRVDIQAGLRFESTILNGNQLGNIQKPSSTFNRVYNNLFPTLYTSFKLDSAANHLLILSYGKRINRPFFKDLNPFVRPLDKFTYYSGNPFIQPTFAHNSSIAYSYKTFITTTFSYSYSKNNIQETIEINEGIYYSRPGNIGKSQILSLSFESAIPIGKWLKTSLYSEVIYAKYNSILYGQILNRSGFYYTFNMVNSLTFKKGWSAEISGEAISNFIDSQFSFLAFGFLNFGLQKNILRDKGSLKLGLTDVLFTKRITGEIHSLQLATAGWRSRTDSRVGTITFSYRFGTAKNQKPKHTTTGSATEQNRIKK